MQQSVCMSASWDAMCDDLQRQSAPFLQFGFGASVAQKLQERVMLQPVGATPCSFLSCNALHPSTSQQPLSSQTIGWEMILDGCWLQWIHDRRPPRVVGSSNNNGCVCDVPVDKGESVVLHSSLYTRHLALVTLCYELCVIAYLLEAAMRRLMWLTTFTMMPPSSDATHNKPSPSSTSSKALHSVLLSDISRSLLDTWLPQLAVASDLLMDRLQQLHNDFVDPTITGCNLRNLIQHGYFMPCRASLQGRQRDDAESVMEDDNLNDLSLPLVQSVHRLLLHHLETVAMVCSIAEAQQQRNNTHATPTTTSLQASARPLPLVGMEREPRRRESVDILQELLACAGPTITTTPASVSLRMEGAASDTVIASLLADIVPLFPRLEMLLRLIIVGEEMLLSSSSSSSRCGGVTSSTIVFAPVVGRQFDDLEALFAWIGMHPLRDRIEGIGRGPDDEAVVSYGCWELLEAMLVDADGPRCRDVLLHSKWDPLDDARRRKMPSSMCGCGEERGNGDGGLQAHASCNVTIIASLISWRNLLSSIVRNIESYCCIRCHEDEEARAPHHRRHELHAMMSAMATHSNVPFAAMALWPLQQVARRLSAWHDHSMLNITHVSRAKNSEAAAAPEGNDVAPVEHCRREVVAIIDSVWRTWSSSSRRRSPADSACANELHATIDAMTSFVSAFDQRVLQLEERVMARKAREQQREQYHTLQAHRGLLIALCSLRATQLLRMAVVASSSLHDNRTAVSQQQRHSLTALRRECRLFGATIAPSAVGAIEKVLKELQTSTSINES